MQYGAQQFVNVNKICIRRKYPPSFKFVYYRYLVKVQNKKNSKILFKVYCQIRNIGESHGIALLFRKIRYFLQTVKGMCFKYRRKT